MSTGGIAVLGSANMDLVVTVDRAPGRGETVTGRTFTTVPGGKGANQALAAARAGAAVRFLGAVGDDDFGRTVSTILRADGIDVSGLVTSAEPTGTAHITVDGDGDNSIVVVPGANGSLAALTPEHRAGIEAADLLLLQLELPLPLVAEAAAHARAAGVRTVLTPAPAVPLPSGLLGDVDVLVPNEHEAALLAHTGDPVAAGHRLAAECGDVVVTLGSQGAVHIRGGDERRVPAFAVPAVDTTAAGDTFVGVLAASLAEQLPWEAAMRRAGAAAALSVQRFGASSSMPARGEIDAFLATGG
ncbi:ribokinase [Haloactinopolyspora alba]|uniref:Ribokinase n=1 Tax=Haloactinopolyspora alba TaxID=648780 RepID=A0A2P8E9J3_9ACTN|nr:ribokinase [Haloactinopolyspora alba]PSL06139.1 ribokinase [Haloactinopolyspora alba]